jgi:hypothetical protein
MLAVYATAYLGPVRLPTAIDTKNLLDSQDFSERCLQSDNEAGHAHREDYIVSLSRLGSYSCTQAMPQFTEW